MATKTIEFHSSLSLDDAVRRLEAATCTGLAYSEMDRDARRKEHVIAEITSEQVSLYRQVPAARNSFKPVFRGEFEHTPEGVTLRGRYSLFRSTLLFSAVWLGGVAVFTVSALIRVLRPSPTVPWWLPLAGLAIGAAGYGVFAFSRRMARSDTAVIDATIRRALG